MRGLLDGASGRAGALIRSAAMGAVLALGVSACTITPWRTAAGDASQPSPGASAKGTPLTVETSPVPTPPVAVAAANDAAAAPGFYRVKPGDTLYHVAKARNLRPADVASWNKLPVDAKVQAGQMLRVTPPPAAAGASAAAASDAAADAKNAAAKSVAPKPAAAVAAKAEPKSEPKSEPKAEPKAEAKAEPKAESRAEARTAATPARSPRFVWPIEGSVTQPFKAKSKGVVMAGPAGQDVRAVASGYVVYAGSGMKSYGKLVIVKHDAHLITAYGRNGKLLVKQGDAVKQGEPIAVSATDNGKASLVFEMREDGKPVDPLARLPR
ncbi:M23 family metallopeptidase [Paraburkholderia sp. J41]|uniref:M23 family metallopeptidase n=1 Tax=Paraburkholderia sp. J41 TaxID=2805433 RepID=UPI002AC32F16|nr:M23 family metallopeptidase [Paraburkholderia sp. J41]